MLVSKASASTTDAHISEGPKVLIHPKYIRIVPPEAYQNSDGPSLLSEYFESEWEKSAVGRYFWNTDIPQRVTDALFAAPEDLRQSVLKDLGIERQFYDDSTMPIWTRNLMETRYVSPSCGHAHP